MAAGVVWTRGQEDRPGAQMAYFASPLHSPLLLQEEQPTFWWEESPLQQHQSSLQLLQTSAKEENCFPHFPLPRFPKAKQLPALCWLPYCSGQRGAWP